MARGNDQAQQASKSALGYSGTLQNQQGSLYGALAPQLMGDISHPTGFTPNEKAEQNTAAQESAGGSEAGAVGQGALLSQRTRNSGTADAAVGESARNAGRGSMRAALGTELADTALKNQKMAAAKGELGGLYGTSTQGGNAALGQVASNVNANTEAENASWNWAKYILDPAMQAAGSAATMGAGCWIAEAIYGVDDARTHLVRAWLNGPFNHGIGALVMKFYLRFGQSIARAVRKSAVLRWMLKPLFDMALEKAIHA